MGCWLLTWHVVGYMELYRVCQRRVLKALHSMPVTYSEANHEIKLHKITTAMNRSQLPLLEATETYLLQLLLSSMYLRVLNIWLMNVNFSHAAIKYDNIDVFGYTAWSLLDGFEWQHAYKIRRGLFYVDFKSEKKERIPKSSALYYKQIIQENGFFPRESTPSVQAQFSCDFSWGITESVLKVRVNKIQK